MRRQSSSEAAWSLLTSAVSEARVEAHRLRHLMNRGLKVIEQDTPEQREHLYQLAGDIIEAGPERLTRLEQLLDKTQFALSKMGEDFFASRLPISDKTEVNEAIEHSAHPFSKTVKDSVNIVTARYLRRADLSPPLGTPGGPCGVAKRIDQEVQSPAVKEPLLDKVQRGLDLPNPDAAKVYDIETDVGGGYWKKMRFTSHGQYRMDLRGVTVARIRQSLIDLSNRMKKDKRLEAEATWGRKFEWSNKGLTIILESEGPDVVHIITAYPTSGSDPKPPAGGCKL